MHWAVIVALFVGTPALPSVRSQTVTSIQRDEVRVEYKSGSICEETPGVSSYSGYIRLPPGALEEVGLDQHYPANIFFWYFQNRQKRSDAPLTVYLNGGPGASSLMSLFKEHGPCKVNGDSNSTRTNRWSWNSESDMLYLDQPVQTGFSYDELQPGTLDAQGSLVLDDITTESTPILGRGARRGVFSSYNPRQTVNSTQSVARSTWFYLQIWLQKFDKRKSSNSKINFWTSSYGGHFVPTLIQYALAQNARLDTGDLNSELFVPMPVATLGMTNACVDGPIQLPQYPEMARGNTYDLRLASQAAYDSAKEHFSKPGGCLSKIKACRAASPAPSDDLGQDDAANAICRDANAYCGTRVAQILGGSGASYFDIAYPETLLADPLSETYFGFLNQPHVQEALGVPLNFTGNSPVVAHAFSSTGDNVKGGPLEALGNILDGGVSVVLVYGDRDYACNWFGGEALSRAIPHSQSHSFRRAGLTDLWMPGYPVGAQVRQAGPLSFVRVHSAGHTVGLQQPLIAQTVFNRATAGVDIATGTVGVSPNYSSPRTYTSWGYDEEAPPTFVEGACYTLDLGLCSARQRRMFLDGSATVRDFFIVEDDIGECVVNPVQPCEGKEAHRDAWKNKFEAPGVEGEIPVANESQGNLMLLLMATAACVAYLVCRGILRSCQERAKPKHVYLGSSEEN